MGQGFEDCRFNEKKKKGLDLAGATAFGFFKNLAYSLGKTIFTISFRAFGYHRHGVQNLTFNRCIFLQMAIKFPVPVE